MLKNFWRKYKKSDTTAEFYSNIDRLYKLINIALEKDQTKNAEEYINYFFTVLVRYYKKESLSTKLNDRREAQVPVNITSNTDESSAKEENAPPILPNRTINNFFGDFFTDKIIQLLTQNIKSRRYEIFNFILLKLKDSIRILLKSEESLPKASILLRQIKFIFDQIYSKKDELSEYEKDWYLNESFNWFIELYSSSVEFVEIISMLEDEIIQILKYFVDYDRVDLFEIFLLRLSSSTFSFSFRLDALLKSYQPSQESFKEYHDYLSSLRNLPHRLKGIVEIKNELDEINKNISQKFLNFSFSKEQVSDFKSHFIPLLLDEYKQTYLKIILVKVIVYSFFKKRYDFFAKYLTYNQPDDADATWVSEYYGIRSIDEVFVILDQGNDIILNGGLFWIGHHGFRVYLNTFLAYYLIKKFDEREILSRIKALTEYPEALSIRYALQEIKNKNRLLEIPIVKDQISKDELNRKLDEFIGAAEKKEKALVLQQTTIAQLSTEVVDSFNAYFINHFNKFCTLRLLFEEFDKLELKGGEGKISGIGISELLPKQLFLKGNSLGISHVADVYAGALAKKESLSISLEIEAQCSRKVMTKSQVFEDINIHKNEFDIIISMGRYDVKSDFPNLDFKESWSLKSGFTNIPDFLGLLDEHYKVFLIRDSSKEGYILLNSKKFPTLQQLEPPSLEDGRQNGIFNFSIIDFNENEQSLNRFISQGNERTELLMSVWVRIFEKYQIFFDKSFNGIFLELNS